MREKQTSRVWENEERRQFANWGGEREVSIEAENELRLWEELDSPHP
jgi:hypothetical protein